MICKKDFDIRKYICEVNYGEYSELDLATMLKDGVISAGEYAYLISGDKIGEKQLEFFKEIIEKNNITWALTYGACGDPFYSGEENLEYYLFKDYENNCFYKVYSDDYVDLSKYDITFLNKIYG